MSAHIPRCVGECEDCFRDQDERKCVRCGWSGKHTYLNSDSECVAALHCDARRMAMLENRLAEACGQLKRGQNEWGGAEHAIKKLAAERDNYLSRAEAAAKRVAQLEREIAALLRSDSVIESALREALAAVEGALADAGNIPVPSDWAKLGDAVRALIRNRDIATPEEVACFDCCAPLEPSPSRPHTIVVCHRCYSDMMENR